MVRKWMIGIVSAVMVVTAAAQPLFAGPVFLDGGDRDDHGSFSAGANQAGWKLIEQALNFLRTNATNSGTGVLVIGASSTALAAVTSATTVLGDRKSVV